MGRKRAFASEVPRAQPSSSMAMKSMKSMKSMKKTKKSMKGMKKAMKKSKIAKGKRAKSSVFRGTKVKTGGGLSKADLKKNKTGKIVSRKASARSAARYSKNKKMQKWTACFKKARKALGIRGFCPCGGNTARGKAFLAKTRSLYKQ